MTELNAPHIFGDHLSKSASEPRNPPKMVAQRAPKGAKRVPRRPSEPQKYITIVPQSLQARLHDYQPTIQQKKQNHATTTLQDLQPCYALSCCSALGWWDNAERIE